MKIKNPSAWNRTTTHACIPSQKPPPLDHSSTFRFTHLLLCTFTHFASHHPTRLLPTAAHILASTPLFTCQNMFPRLHALENAEEINFLFCLWSRGPAAPLNPPAWGHSPGSPFLPPTCHVNMSLLLCQNMSPHHSIICHLRASNPRPQLTKFVLLPDMAHISSTASNQGLGPGSYDWWVSVHPVCLKSAYLLHWLDRYSIKPR